MLRCKRGADGRLLPTGSAKVNARVRPKRVNDTSYFTQRLYALAESKGGVYSDLRDDFISKRKSITKIAQELGWKDSPIRSSCRTVIKHLSTKQKNKSVGLSPEDYCKIALHYFDVNATSKQIEDLKAQLLNDSND